jgi:hypothetical protein
MHGDTTGFSVTDPSELATVLERIHLSDIFNVEDDDDYIHEEDGIDSVLHTANNTIEDIEYHGTPEFQAQLRDVCDQFSDVFRHSVRPEPALVPPMEFGFDLAEWEKATNRLPSRPMSPEKQTALREMLQQFLDLGVIRPSTATAWSQVHLVRKPKGGWRFTIDFRGINKCIVNQGWQIPNIQQMLERIGARRPKFFGSADLTQGYFQMPLAFPSQKATAFITYQGIFEWTRVPMGILPSANYFQRSMQYEVLKDLLYTVCEVYIDDLFIMGDTPSEFIVNLTKVLQRLRYHRMTLNP